MYTASLIQRHNARAIKAGSRGVLTIEQWRNIVDAFGWRCAYCQEYSGQMQLDHIIAIANGGDTDCHNVVPACPSCNNRKRAAGPFEFAFSVSVAGIMRVLKEANDVQDSR